jgi:hypothetical protein
VSARRVDGFFYGLFLDMDVLRKAGVAPSTPRPALVEDLALKIGQRATLVSSPGSRVYGMVIALTHAELERLYSAPGLEGYRPEAVVAHTLDGTTVPALCYNLEQAPGVRERNPDYAERLRAVLAKHGFPSEYIESIT